MFQTEWYRFAVLLTGRPVLATTILKEVAGEVAGAAAAEIDQLRSPQGKIAWLARTIQEKCLQALNSEAATAEAPVEPWLKVVALPANERTVFALFHCLHGETDSVAELLGLRTGFSELLAKARQALAPQQYFSVDSQLVLHRPWGRDSAKVARAVKRVSDKESLPLGAQVAFDRRWHERILAVSLPQGVELPNFENAPPLLLMATLRHPAVLAIAFAFVVVLGVIFFGSMRELDEFPGREVLVSLVEGQGGPEWEKVAGAEAGSLGDWFMLKGFDGFTVPQELEHRKVSACRVITVDGQPVAQLTFEDGGGRLFVLRGGDLGVEPGAPEWRFFQQLNEVVGVMEEGKNCYVLIVTGEGPELKQYLEARPVAVE